MEVVTIPDNITTVYTDEKKYPPPPEPAEQPENECTIPFKSYEITRYAMKKIMAMAKAVYDHVGRVECYCLLISNKPDLLITDIIIPHHTGSSAHVTVEPQALDEVRNKLFRMNQQIENEEERWKVVGWAHSHVRMSVFFSPTDWNNQQLLLNAAGVITKRFGQTITVVYGMTVNVNEQVYAEVLNRLKCGLVMRQRGAMVKVHEDVDGNYDELYNQLVDEVKEKVTTHISRVWPGKRAKTTTIYDFATHSTSLPEITDEDLIKEIRNKMRSAKGILLKAAKGGKFKGRLISADEEKEKVERVLFDLTLRIKEIMLSDVAEIIRGNDIEEKVVFKKPSSAVTGTTKQSKAAEKKYKYEEYIEEIKASTEIRDFASMNYFIKFIKGKIKGPAFRYLKKSRSLMRDKLEGQGFTFRSTPDKKGKQNVLEEIIEKSGEHHNTPSVATTVATTVKEIKQTILDQDELKEFLDSLGIDSTTKNMLESFLGANPIEVLSDMTVTELENTLGCLPLHAKEIKEKAITRVKLLEKEKEKDDAKEFSAGKFVDYLYEKGPEFSYITLLKIKDHLLGNGLYPSDIVEMEVEELSNIMEDTEEEAENVLEITREFIKEQEDQKELRSSDSYDQIYS